MAIDDSGFSTAENIALSIPASALLANDTGFDGTPLSITGVSNGANGTVSYDATTQTVSFVPTSGYTGMASFTYSIGQGSTASANVALLVYDPSAATLFSLTSTPSIVTANDTNSAELGVKFQASEDGDITGIRFYKSAQNTGPHVADLWSATGTLLATATFTNEAASGWQQVNFSTPVAISAGTTYVASYHTNGDYSEDPNLFATGLTSGPLTAPVGAGVFAYGSSSLFPANSVSNSYGVDVVFKGNLVANDDSGFITTENTALSVSASALLANDKDPVSLPLSISSVSNASNGTVSYDSSTQTVSFMPTAGYTGTASFSYSITDGLNGTASANVALFVYDPSAASLFSLTSTPSIVTANDPNSVELGVKFQASEDGDLTGIRFYKGPQNTGPHVADLWSATGALLATATFTNETASGWQQVNFSSPVAISAGTTYVASYHTNGDYSADPNLFATALTSGPLTASVDAGVFAYGSSSLFPTSSVSNSYGVDVVFNASQGPVSVTISGVAQEGQTLTALTVDSNGNAVVSDQWQSLSGSTWSNISGSTGSTYLVAEIDEGQQLRVMATVTDNTGTISVASSATAAVTDITPTPATPTVSGNAIEGSTLTASSVTTGSDEALTIAYQWQTSANGTSGWTSIASNSTSSTYVLQEADENQFIRVQETFTDDTGQSTTVASAATNPVVDVAPTPATPTVSGNAIEGSTLTASSVTTGSDEALTIAYQWQTSANGTSGWTSIASNSTSSTYVLQEANENQSIRVQETFTDDTGQSTTVASAATNPVVDVAPSPATPTISGNAIEGSTLTASSVTTGSDEALTIAYQWQTSANGTSGWTNIASNSTSSTYVLQEADENQFIRVQENFTDDSVQSITVASAATNPVVDVAPTPATPTISGNAIEGSTLTASSVTTGSDEALTIAYQWQTSANGTSGWTNIASNSTSSTYVLQEANENQFIRVQETFTDDTGQSTTVASAATNKVVDVAPSAATPTISGNAIEGSTLTASSVTTGSDEALTIAYQWQTSANGTSGWTNIASNSTSSTYVLQEANENQFIRVQETFTDDTGQSTTVASAATNKVVDVAPTPATPTVSGTTIVGSTLTASSVTTGSDEALTIAYQWQTSANGTSGWTNIASNSTSSTYVLQEANENQFIRVQETFTDDTGQSTTVASAATNPVVDVAPTLSVTVSGTAKEGQTLTATRTVTSDSDGGTTTYQWQSLSGSTWSNISGATGSTYRVAEANEGHQLRVTATFTDDTGQSVSALSSATTAVTDITPTLSVTISGSAQEGKTLTANAVANDADAVVTYQWQSHIGSTWTNISGATASTYVVTEANEGTQLRVIATSTDSDGSGTTATSAATGLVTDPPATLTVTLSSTAQEGQILTATAVASSSNSTITYQWQSLSGSTWSNIAGATAATYKVAETNEGHQLRVVATSTDSDGTGATANSVATAAVTDVPAPLTISNNSITVAAGGSVPLPIKVGTSDGDDTVTVTITGLTSYETVTDGLDPNVFSGSSITLTAAEVNSGLTLSSSYTGTDHPVNVLNVTSNIITSGEAVTSPVQTITVTDPPAATTTSIQDQPSLAPAGVAGEAINLGLTNPTNHVGSITVNSNGNIIMGTTADATFNNVDNIISNAGQLGEGQVTLRNSGSIIASGSNALTIDTGANEVINSGTLRATGTGGLIVHSDVTNSGLLWANGGSIRIDGNVSGTGSALIDGEATLEVGGRFGENIALDPGAHATVKIDHAADFSGTVAGLAGNDVFDLADLAFGSNTTLGYAANSNNTGGTMTVSDGTHTANIALLGQYMAASFSMSADGFGGTLIHDVPSAVLPQTLTRPQHA